jgi:hypothetical protein
MEHRECPSQAELYREKALEAEARAAHAALDSIKESWLRIANCYREMAEQNIRMQ